MLGFAWGSAELHWGAVDLWTPPQAVLRSLEAQLPTEFRRTMARAVLLPHETAGEIENYYRQYAGFVRRDGSHGVLVHGIDRRMIAFLDSVSRERMDRGQRAYRPNWREEYFGVADGGLVTFFAVYSVERTAFDSLRFGDRFSGPVEMREEP